MFIKVRPCLLLRCVYHILAVQSLQAPMIISSKDSFRFLASKKKKVVFLEPGIRFPVELAWQTCDSVLIITQACV